MKVVLFCGGAGLKLPDSPVRVPKPMVEIGYRPILWHVMRWYAHWGLRDFVLCLGDRADLVKRYFLTYDEALSNDFVLSNGGRTVELLSSDIQDWRITFADTGRHTRVGGRLLAVRRYLEGEEVFCANYGDIVTDAPFPTLLEDFKRQGKVAAFLSVRPPYSFHIVDHEGDGTVTTITDTAGADLWINGGYYFFRQEVFDYVHGDEDLVEEPFARLIADDQLIAYRHEGFWISLDTLKDLQTLESLYASGSPPWAVWR